MVSYKLTYFPTRGNGEIARQVFAYAGQEFEDERIPKEQWEDMKQCEFRRFRRILEIWLLKT